MLGRKIYLIGILFFIFISIGISKAEEVTVENIVHERQIYYLNPIIVCVDCNEDKIVIERNLKVYEVMNPEARSRISLITIDVENRGDNEIKDFSLIEYVPREIADRTDINFTLQPMKIEEDEKNIVITWMFKYLPPKGQVNAGYMIINKEVPKDMISSYSPSGEVADYAEGSKFKLKDIDILLLLIYISAGILILGLFVFASFNFYEKWKKIKKEEEDEDEMV